MVAAGTGSVLVFISITGIALVVMPGPLRPIDYFTAGVIGTLLSLSALFVTCVRLSNFQDVLYRKRPVKRTLRRRFGKLSLIQYEGE